MASKRKSTVPCMIPVKTLHLQGGLEQARRSPTTKESSLLPDEASGRGHRGRSESPAQDPGTDLKDNGTYTCRLCNFETQDLNLFLDHVYSGHPEFRSEPSFFCVDCGVGAAKFEGLALHNARVHPSTVTTALQLKRKDRKFTVEQSIVAGAPETKESEISITKAPIMKIMSRKSEPKKIVVSHGGADEAAAKQAEPADAPAVTHVPTIVHNGSASKVTAPSALQIVNGSGALPVLKTGITQVVSVVQNRSLGQQSSSTPPPGPKSLPKVMIPLSSIPTYNASMDGSSFLKTSFSKFPYPTKAELCYLTVVTKYPEEQIKIWFTAQRLKQGISWSPEEIEDARRKMFNTIIQTAPSSAQRQGAVAVLPASLGASGVPRILQGNLVSQGGVIVTQPIISNGIQVNNAPVALAVTPKPQAAAKPMQAKPAAAPAADKGLGMLVGSVGSSNSGNATVSTSGVISSVGSSGANQTSVISIGASSGTKPRSTASSTKADDPSADAKTADDRAPPEVKTSTGADTDSKEGAAEDATASKGDAESKRSPGVPAQLCPSMDNTAAPGKSESPSLSASRGIATPSLLDPSFFKAKKSQEQLSALKESFLVSQFPAQEEVDRLISLTGLTVREVRKWFSDRRYHFRNTKSSKSGGGAQAPAGSGNPSVPAEPPDNSACPDRPKTPTQVPTSPPRQPHTTPPTPTRRHIRALSPDFTAVRYKEREPHQLRALASSFARDPDPPEDEVDRLRAETKMTRREIHAWFAERRKRAAAERKREELRRAERDDDEKGDAGAPEDAAKEAPESRDDPEDDAGAAELKVNPIKINLKMLKVTEADGSPPPETTKAPSPAPQTSQNRTKKTPDQLHLLKQAFARTHWPSSPLYNELILKTGLPRAEVVRWFGDCRYVLKNGQLKWLESYQAMVEDEELGKGDASVLREHLKTYGRLLEDQRGALARSSGLSEELVSRWFARRPDVSGTEASSSTVAAAIESVLRDAEATKRTGASTDEEQGCED